MGGGDKCLRPLGGRPILARVIERARPQVEALVLNANGDPARFAGFGLPVVADVGAGFAGPLAGVLTGLEWAAAHRPGCAWVVSIATDTPFFPPDLVARLLAAVAAEGAPSSPAPPAAARPIRCSGCGRWRWPASCAGRSSRRGLRKIDAWTARYRLAVVEFPVGAGRPVLQRQPAGGPGRGRAAAGVE